MAEQELKKSIVGFNPQGDFIEGGSALPKRFRGPVKLARFAPWPIKRDGAKHGYFAIIRIEDLETEIEHDLRLRAGWLPKRFDDGRIGGTVPSNDGPDVDDDEREPTAELSVFIGLGDGSKPVPEGTDLVDEYGGLYSMGDGPGKDEPFFKFCEHLAECEFPFTDQSIASLEEWILTVESTEIGEYQKDGQTKKLKAHMPVEAEPPAKKKSKAGTESVAKKSKPKPADDDDEDEETPKTKTTATTKRKPEPEPEEDEDESEEESGGPVEVLHDAIVQMLKKTVNRQMQEGEVMREVIKDAEFRKLRERDRKTAVNAYNDRSLFEESDVLILDEEADTVSLKGGKKGK